jgi:methionine synthase II (cobalamin-independent)
VHCCGNTDWGLLLQTKIDILSFDAYQFFEKLLLYHDKLRDFFGRGGVLSLGIVPTDEEAFLHESTESLVGRVRMMVERLSDGGMSGKNFIITPTCGMGTLSTKISELILKVTGEVSACLRKT